MIGQSFRLSIEHKERSKVKMVLNYLIEWLLTIIECDTDVIFLPATFTIAVRPSMFRPSKPDTGLSLRGCRGVCCSPIRYERLSGSCGASDAPAGPLVGHEKKELSFALLELVQHMFEDRTAPSPLAFHQPVRNNFGSSQVFFHWYPPPPPPKSSKYKKVNLG